MRGVGWALFVLAGVLAGLTLALLAVAAWTLHARVAALGGVAALGAYVLFVVGGLVSVWGLNR